MGSVPKYSLHDLDFVCRLCAQILCTNFAHTCTHTERGLIWVDQHWMPARFLCTHIKHTRGSAGSWWSSESLNLCVLALTAASLGSLNYLTHQMNFIVHWGLSMLVKVIFPSPMCRRISFAMQLSLLPAGCPSPPEGNPAPWRHCWWVVQEHVQVF